MPNPTFNELQKKYKINSKNKRNKDKFNSVNVSVELESKLKNFVDEIKAVSGGKHVEYVREDLASFRRKPSLDFNFRPMDRDESKEDYYQARDQKRLELLEKGFKQFDNILEQYVGEYDGSAREGIYIGSKADVNELTSKYANSLSNIQVNYVDNVLPEDLIRFLSSEQRNTLEYIATQCNTLRNGIKDKSLLTDEYKRNLSQEIKNCKFKTSELSPSVEKACNEECHKELIRRLDKTGSPLPVKPEMGKRTSAFVESNNDFTKIFLRKDELENLRSKSTVELVNLLGSYQNSDNSLFNLTGEKREFLREKMREGLTQFNVDFARQTKEATLKYSNKFTDYANMPITDKEIDECISYYQREQENSINNIVRELANNRGLKLENIPFNGSTHSSEFDHTFSNNPNFNNDYGFYDGKSENHPGINFSNKSKQVKKELDKLVASNEYLKPLLEKVYPSPTDVQKKNLDVASIDEKYENIRNAYDDALETYEKKKAEYFATMSPEEKQFYLEEAQKAVANNDLNPGGKYTVQDLMSYIEGVQYSSLNQYHHLKEYTDPKESSVKLEKPEVTLRDLLPSLVRRQLAPAALAETLSEETLKKAKKIDDKIAEKKAEEERLNKEAAAKHEQDYQRKIHAEQSEVFHRPSYRQFVARSTALTNPYSSYSPYNFIELYQVVSGKADLWSVRFGKSGEISSETMERNLNPDSSLLYMSEEKLAELAKPISEIIQQENKAREEAGKPILGDPDILAKEYIKDYGHGQKIDMQNALEKSQVSPELVNKNKEAAINELEAAISKSDLFKKALENSTPLFRADIERQVRIKQGIDPDKVEIVPAGDPRELGYFAYSPANLQDLYVPNIDRNTYVTYATEKDYEEGFHENERRYEDYKKRYLLNLSEDERKQYKEEAERLMKDNPKLNADDLMRYIETKQEQSIFNYNYLLNEVRLYGHYSHSEEEAKWFSSMKHPAISGVENFKEVIGLKYGAPELINEIKKYEKEHGIAPKEEEKVEEVKPEVEEVKPEVEEVKPEVKEVPKQEEKVEEVNPQVVEEVKPEEIKVEEQVAEQPQVVEEQKPEIKEEVPQEQPKEEIKEEVPQEQPKEEIKEEIKEEVKEEVKEVPKEEEKVEEQPKEEIKEEAKEEVKEVPKEEEKVEEQPQVVEEQKPQEEPQVVEEQKPQEQPNPVEDPDFVSHEMYPVPPIATSENEIKSFIKSQAGAKYPLLGSLINYDVADVKHVLSELTSLSPEDRRGYKNDKLTKQYEELGKRNASMYSEFKKYRINSLSEEQEKQLDNELEEASKDFGITKDELNGVVRTIYNDIYNAFDRQLDTGLSSYYKYDDYHESLGKMGESILCKDMLENPEIKDSELEIDPDYVEDYELYLADERMQNLLSKSLGGKKISDLSWKEYLNLERDALDVLQAFDKASGADLSSVSDVRSFFKYYSAKKDNLLTLKYDENAKIVGAEFDTFADQIDSQYKNTAFEELENLVNGSELLQSYLNNAEPMGKQDVLVDNIKAFQSNEKMLQEKISSFYDNLSDDKKLELQNEAEKITNGHKYLNSADVMKYFVHKQYDTILKYRATVDPNKLDPKFDDYTFAPCTMDALKRSIGEKCMNLELAKEKPEEVKEEIKQEEVKQEPEKVVEEVKPQVVEEQNFDAMANLYGRFEDSLYEKIILNNTDLRSRKLVFGLENMPENVDEYDAAIKNISKDPLFDTDAAHINALTKYYKDWFKKPENLEAVQKLCDDNELAVLPYLDAERFVQKISDMQVVNLAGYYTVLDQAVPQDVASAAQKVDEEKAKAKLQAEPKKEEKPQIKEKKQPKKQLKEKPVKQELEPAIDIDKNLENSLYEKIILNNADSRKLVLGLENMPDNVNAYDAAIKNISKDPLFDTDAPHLNALTKNYKDWFKKPENLETVQKLCSDEELTVLPYLNAEKLVQKMTAMQVENLSMYYTVLGEPIPKNVTSAAEEFEKAKAKVQAEPEKVAPQPEVKEVPKQNVPQPEVKEVPKQNVPQPEIKVAPKQEEIKAEVKVAPKQEAIKPEIKAVPKQEAIKPVVKEEPKKVAPQPAIRLTNQQVTPFAKEIARLAGRIKDSQSTKHQNSGTYEALRDTISKYADPQHIANANDLKGALDELNEKADAYLSQHADEKNGLFKTFGKARQERIKTCARIKAMTLLTQNGIPYDSETGRKIMLASKLICAEKINQGFKGFLDICKDGAINEAIQNKMKDPDFKLAASALVKNDKDYDKFIKISSKNCLKAFNNGVASLKKSGEANKIQKQEEEPKINYNPKVKA